MILENDSLFMLAGSQIKKKKKGYFWVKFLLLNFYTSYLVDESCALTSILPQSTNQSPSGLWDPEVTWKGKITSFFFFLIPLP